MRANGAVVGPLVALLISMFPVRLGFIWLTHGSLGAESLWLSFNISSLVTVLISAWLYLRGSWRKTKLIEQPSDEECRDTVHSEAEAAGRIKPSA